MVDFPIQHRDRNWEIWRMRVIEMRTLRAIGRAFNLSHERVRQIVNLGNQILGK